MLNKLVADNILIYSYFSEKIRLDISCELSANSHKMSSLIYSEKFRMSSAAVVIGILRIKLPFYTAQVVILEYIHLLCKKKNPSLLALFFLISFIFLQIRLILHIIRCVHKFFFRYGCK